MPHSYLLFDFGSNEETAQQARLRLENWKQAFRLDKKLLVKFDRKETETAPPENSEKKKAASGKASNSEGPDVGLIVRLDFSDHERLSHQRWLERIPTEALFRDAHPKIIRPGDADFVGTAERFDALD